MRTLSRLTLAAALLGSLAAPALANPTPAPLPHRHPVVRTAPRVHSVAAAAATTDQVKPGAVRTPAVTATTPAAGATVTTPAASASVTAPRAAATVAPTTTTATTLAPVKPN